MLELVDIGANLTHDSFDADREAVIDRAIAAGVRTMIVTGSSVSASREAIELARAWPNTLYATAGIHPHHAKDYQEHDFDELHALFHTPETVAAGECGLDFFRNFSPADAQKRVFALQLDLAAEHGMPAFLHQRDAHDDFAQIVKGYIDRIPRAVAHCFTGDERELNEYLEMDLYIGITGWVCDERRGKHLKELVKQIPLNRLMLETDAPYLLPRDLSPRPKSRRNEPMFLVHILETVAACIGISPPELAEATTRNARRFFNLPSASFQQS